MISNNYHKLLCDFLVLLCTTCQSNVFNIEQHHKEKDYPGGSNRPIEEEINLMCSGQLPTKTYDFVYPRNWFDITKCIVYFDFFWITLAVVLLTGTHNVSVFSLGYLISSFLFSYFGANFYMKPIYIILRWWRCLIGFNLLVIFAKTVLNLRLNHSNEILSSFRNLLLNVTFTVEVNFISIKIKGFF